MGVAEKPPANRSVQCSLPVGTSYQETRPGRSRATSGQSSTTFGEGKSPSPIVVDDCLLIARLRPGLVSCYDVTTGSEHWTERLEGGFSATPIVAGGLVYAVNEAGRTFVIRPGKKLEVVASNSLQASEEEVFRASPVPFDGHLLLRSDKHLYCVGTR